MQISRRVRMTSTAAIGSVALVCGFAVTSAQAAPASTGAAAKAAVATPKLGVGGRVIVVLKDQAAAPNSGYSSSQVNTAVTRRSGVVRQLQRAGAAVTGTYSVVNAVAARVTEAEAVTLAADPDVAQVIPDEIIRDTPATVSPTATAAAAPAATTPVAGACNANGKVQLEPGGVGDHARRLRRAWRQDRPLTRLHRRRRDGRLDR